jgi:hypothetical protein
VIFCFKKIGGGQISGFPFAPTGAYASSITSSTASNPLLNATTGLEMLFGLQGKNKPWPVISLRYILKSCQYLEYTARRMLGWLITDGSKIIWQEVVVAQLRFYPGICLEGLRKTTNILTHDGRCFGEASNRVLPERESTALPPGHSVRIFG